MAMKIEDPLEDFQMFSTRDCSLRIVVVICFHRNAQHPTIRLAILYVTYVNCKVSTDVNLLRKQKVQRASFRALLRSFSVQEIFSFLLRFYFWKIVEILLFVT